jgi:hypothetical protein
MRKSLRSCRTRQSGPKRKREASSVTTMIPEYFGFPQQVVRSGMWAKLKPTEAKLYLILWHESERYCSRELRLKDVKLQDLTGMSSRSFCSARKRLKERQLILLRRSTGGLYVYTLCDPKTGKAWPGDPRHPIPYVKKSDGSSGFVRVSDTPKMPITSMPIAPNHRYAQRTSSADGISREARSPSETLPGIPLDFSSHT